jgi:DNA-binding transcriptional ArsR family regulator
MGGHLRGSASVEGNWVSRRESEKLTVARRQIRQAEAFEGLGQVAKVLCEPARLRIVEALMTAELSVSDLAAVIERKVAATSQHLRLLRELGVVEGDRRGKAVFYRLRQELLVNHLRTVLSMLADPDARERKEHDGIVRRPGSRRRSSNSRDAR